MTHKNPKQVHQVSPDMIANLLKSRQEFPARLFMAGLLFQRYKIIIDSILIIQIDMALFKDTSQNYMIKQQ